MPTETWRRLDESRRRAVLDAAEAEFASRGFSRASLNVIARNAGVAKGSLFQYFDDKADLFIYLCDRASERVDDAMTEAAAEIDWSVGFFAAYTRLIEAWVHHFRTHPIDRELSAAVSLEPDPDVRRAVRAVVDQRWVEYLRPLLERARVEGALRPDADIDAFIALLVLLLPHLAIAPTYSELDPVMGLGGDHPEEAVRRFMVVFENAFGSGQAGR